MNRIVIALTVSLFFFVTGCDVLDKPVSLKWDVKPGTAIAFSIETVPFKAGDDFSFSIDAEKFLGKREVPQEAIDSLSNIKLPAASKFLAIIQGQPDGELSIKLIAQKIEYNFPPKTELEKKTRELANQHLNTVSLRANLTDTGKLKSFYLPQVNKNWLAMFFELPSHKVKVGDIWSIGVNFTQLGQYFVAERAEQINIVKLASVSKNESGSRIATIDYMITEKIKGRFKEPGQTKERKLEGVTSFIGKGEFNLDQGRWQSFVAQMRIKSSGTLSGDIRQILKMTPVDQIPDELLKLE